MQGKWGLVLQPILGFVVGGGFLAALGLCSCGTWAELPHSMWDLSSLATAALEVVVAVAQSCPTLCNSLDCYLPSSSVHGILQARMLK